jgi:hypothetical protein
MHMKSKSLTRQATYVVFSFTFAGALFSQSVEKNQQSTEATPILMASITKPDTPRYEKPEKSVSQHTETPVAGSLLRTDTSVERMSFSPKLNTIAWVPEKSPSHNSPVRVEPDVLPLNVRLDPMVTEKYGAAPAVVRLSFGRK